MITIVDSNNIPILDSLGNQITSFDYDYSGNFMSERKVTVSIKSPYKIDFPIGCMVVFRGHFFYLQTKPIAQRVYNSEMISYTLIFHSVEYELGLVAFQDVVLNDNSLYNESGNLDVVIYGTIDQLMSRIVANLKRALNLSDGQNWTYTIYNSVDQTIVKDIVLTNGYCSDAMLLINSVFGLEYRVQHPRTILVGYPPETGETVFKFGYNNGLCEINRIQNDAKIITRAIGFGSTRNIPENYRVDAVHKYNPRLMLPASTGGYIENSSLVAQYGIREGIYPTNEEIYPSIQGMTHNGYAIDEVTFAEPIQEDGITETVVVKPEWKERFYNPFIDERYEVVHPATTEQVTKAPSTTATFYVNYPGFNVFDEGVLSSNPPKIAFKTGYMQGVEFKILSMERKMIPESIVTPTWESPLYKIVIERDSSDTNHILPNVNVPIQTGDGFVYLDIFMQPSYVEAAETRLLNDMTTWLANNSIQTDGYAITLTEEHLERNPEIVDYIREGNAILIEDLVLDASVQAIMIQALTISFKTDKELPTYNLTVSTTPVKGYLQKIEARLKSSVFNFNAQNYRSSIERSNALKSAYAFERSITNTNGNIKGAVISSQSIQNYSLSPQIRSSNFVLSAYLTTNYLGNVNSAYGSSGFLVHKDLDIVWNGTYDESHRLWTISTPQTFTLDPYTTYWAYIKCDITDGTASWVCSDVAIGIFDVEGYYMLEWGQIVQIEPDKRFIQSPNGVSGVSSYVYIAYGSSIIGADFTMTNNPDLSFMAIKSTTNPIIEPTSSDFEGLWFRRKGQDTGDHSESGEITDLISHSISHTFSIPFTSIPIGRGNTYLYKADGGNDSGVIFNNQVVTTTGFSLEVDADEDLTGIVIEYNFTQRT